MSKYQFRPLDGLLSLDIDKIKSIGVLKSLQYVEDELSPSPKGRAKKLVLFFIVINGLIKNDINFYVKGGIILQYYLKEHARTTNDLDIIIPIDSDIFINQVKEALNNYKSDIRFEVSNYIKKPAHKNYFYNTFNARINVYHDKELIDSFIFEGIYGDIYDKISPISYKGPDFINDNFHYYGVPVEYIFAEKILAITSELDRPYKHLVDAYSLSQINTDIDLLKKYLDIILFEENKTRRKLGYNTNEYQYEIKKNKVFIGSYFLHIIQSGYKIDEDDLIKYLNNWMKEKGL